MAKVYNKLVRDNIIDIIKNSGQTPTYKTLNDSEYIKSLSDKLFEETKEFSEDYSIEELADILEICRAIMIAKNISEDEIKQIMETKRNKNGGFDKRLFLIDVTS